MRKIINVCLWILKEFAYDLILPFTPTYRRIRREIREREKRRKARRKRLKKDPTYTYEMFLEEEYKDTVLCGGHPAFYR